jgi:hypothetical protein
MKVTTLNILDGAHTIRHHIQHKMALTCINTTVWKTYCQKIYIKYLMLHQLSCSHTVTFQKYQSEVKHLQCM